MSAAGRRPSGQYRTFRSEGRGHGHPSRPEGPAVARSPSLPRGAPFERRQSAEAQRRFSDLHEIGKLLLGFDTAEVTISAVLAIMAKALALSGANVVVEGEEGLHMFAWRRPELHSAPAIEEQRIGVAYRYLAGIADQPAVNDVPAGTPRYVRPSSEHLAAIASTHPRERFIVLPLVVNVERAFGAVQIWGGASLGEFDLAFANAIVAEMAIALERRKTADVERTSAESRRVVLGRSERTQHFLADVSSALINFRSHESVLAAAVGLAVPFLADVCFADEISEDGTLSRLKFGFTEESHGALRSALLELALEPTPHGTQTLRTRESLLISDISDLALPARSTGRELQAVGAHSVMVVAIELPGQRFGAFTFVADESRPAYDRGDLALAQEMALLVASAIDNERIARRSERVIRERQEILALVTHDLRDPLAALLAGAGGMLLRPPDTDRRKSRKTLELMDRSVRRMDRMIEDLLDTSSLEAGQLSIGREWHAIASIVEAVLETQAAAASSKSVSLSVRLPRELPSLYCDRERIQQVLVNLLGNAIKFTPADGSVELSVRRNERETIFSVRDTGRGIAAEDHARVFERYWHMRAGGRSRGTGLGLYISKGIVEAHGGQIWVESELHQGAVFSFTIPHGPPQT